MIHLLYKLPQELIVAVSGGPDSMAGLDFLSKSKTRKVSAAYFNHGTEHSAEAEAVVRRYCMENEITFYRSEISSEKQPGQSLEEYWRLQRYEFFEDLPHPVVTCHHLDDCVEWWLFSSFNGNPKLIPHTRGKYLRPFLLNRKQSLVEWCRRKNVPYITDPSNHNSNFNRNRIRRDILPDVLLVNPGIHKVIKKKLLHALQHG